VSASAGRSPSSLNSEFEGASTSFVDHGGLQNHYRFYAVAGTPHMPDFLGFPFITTASTPANYEPALRAHFLQGDAWVRGVQPPPSIHLKTIADGTLDRDGNGNAISVNASGQPVLRLPFVELGEAHFIADFVGSYENAKTIEESGFSSHAAYLKEFSNRLADYARAGYILREDADAMRRRAALCPALTYTQTYRDHYDEFVGIHPLRDLTAATNSSLRDGTRMGLDRTSTILVLVCVSARRQREVRRAADRRVTEGCHRWLRKTSPSTSFGRNTPAAKGAHHERKATARLWRCCGDGLSGTRCRYGTCRSLSPRWGLRIRLRPDVRPCLGRGSGPFERRRLGVREHVARRQPTGPGKREPLGFRGQRGAVEGRPVSTR
jgi:hypothetical protein